MNDNYQRYIYAIMLPNLVVIVFIGMTTLNPMRVMSCVFKDTMTY